MCTTCGCGETGEHSHTHDHDHGHDHEHTHTHDNLPAHSHEDAARLVRIERDILGKNDALAAANRARLEERGIFALNFVSSPGSGKTELLVRTLTELAPRHAIGVIEGDQQTSRDADRIRATGVKAVQINTGKGCHLDAHMVGHALDELSPAPGGLVFIENVGNLVCPSAFDLGEAHKVVVLSVTEGDDKPLKYPDMFLASDLMLINKSDLLPYVSFDLAACMANALQVNPALQILTLSARTGEGMAAWLAWVEARAAHLAKAAGVAEAVPAAAPVAAAQKAAPVAAASAAPVAAE